MVKPLTNQAHLTIQVGFIQRPAAVATPLFGEKLVPLTKYHRNDANPMEVSQKYWNFSLQIEVDLDRSLSSDLTK